MARIALKLTSRARKLSPEQKEAGDLHTKPGNGAEVTHKNIRISTIHGERPSTWVERSASKDPQVKLRISAGGADTMHGFLAKGQLTEPEFGTHELSGEETVHHAAVDLAEVRSAISGQEAAGREVNAQQEAAKQAASNKLYS